MEQRSLPTAILVHTVRAEGRSGHLANWPPYKLLLLMAPRSMPDTRSDFLSASRSPQFTPCYPPRRNVCLSSEMVTNVRARQIYLRAPRKRTSDIFKRNIQLCCSEQTFSQDIIKGFPPLYTLTEMIMYDFIILLKNKYSVINSFHWGTEPQTTEVKEDLRQLKGDQTLLRDSLRNSPVVLRPRLVAAATRT